MNCPYCEHTKSSVSHTFRRTQKDKTFVGRYRKCLSCQLPYLTLEDKTTCNLCECPKSIVIDTQQASAFKIRRRRRCDYCGDLRWTHERVVNVQEEQSTQKNEETVIHNPFME